MVLPIRPKSCRYHPSMTTAFESNDGLITNNCESYNYRMKKALGDHPNLPKFLGALKKENSVIESRWMQNEQPKSRREEEERKFIEAKRQQKDDLDRQSYPSTQNVKCYF